MSAITDLKEQINDLITFKHISSAFTEAAAVKLASIRRAFIRNDTFYNEITHLYHLVQINSEKKDKNEINTGQNPVKRLTVALTSNQRFFGILNSQIMLAFLNYSNKNKTEKLVIGATGEAFLRGSNYKQEYKALTFTQDIPNETESSSFFAYAQDYDLVTIFYPKFETFLKQIVGSIEITSKIPNVDKSKLLSLKQELNLIFEPELSKIENFFEREVKHLLWKRVLLETDLARTAARLLAMSQAEERTDVEIKAKKSLLTKVTRSITNAHLLETFSGIKKWKHALSERRSLAEIKNKLLFLEHAN